MKLVQRFVACLTFLLLLLPSVIKAENTVLENQYNYSITPKSIGVYHFKVVVFSRAFYNHWLSAEKEEKSSLFYKKKGDENTYKIAEFSAENFSGVDYGETREIPFQVHSGVFIINGKKYDDSTKIVKVTTTKASKVDGQETLFLEGEWIPEGTDLQEKDMITFGLEIYDDCHGTLRKHNWNWGPYQYKSNCVAPILTEPYMDMEAVANDKQGTMKIMWSSVKELNKYTLVVSKKDTTIKTEVTLTKGGAQNGEISIDPSNEQRKVTILGEMYADEDDKVLVTIPSNEVVVKPYMSISSFNVDKVYEKERYGNKMKFTWTIDNPSRTDYMSSDVFQLQRAYLPDFSDAVTLTTQSVVTPTDYDSVLVSQNDGDPIYKYTKAIFEYEDDNIENTYNITEESTEFRNIFDTTRIKEVSRVYPYVTIPKKKVYYRLQRNIASSIWEDKVSHRYRIDTALALNYQLPLITDISVEKASNWETSRKVNVKIKLDNYKYKELPAYQSLAPTDMRLYDFKNLRLYTWDERANIVLCRINHEYGDTTKTIIAGTDVKLCDDSTYYYVSATAETPLAFTHTSYFAYVDNTNSYYYINPKVNESSSVSVADSFYFEDCATIDRDNFTATDNLKGGIQLKWSANRGPISYYTLERRPSTGRNWKTIEIDSLQTEYFDQDLEIGKEYEYALKLVYEHLGKKYVDEANVTGRTYPYFDISGRVTTASNAGIANLKVVAVGTSSSDTLVAYTKTDGSYVFDSIPLAKSKEYTVSVKAQNGTYHAKGGENFYKCYLNEDNPYYSGVDFIADKSFVFSGRVLYENSTIPVRGANFMVNDNYLYSNGKKVATDNNGNFAFELPNAKTKIQIVKEGHTFQNDGFIHEKGQPDTCVNFIPETDYKKLEIYDKTRVTLAGRIAGGSEQAAFPLGFNLSENILGDSITIVLELEGDNTAQIVYKKEDPNDVEIDTFFVHHTNKALTDSVGVTNVKYQRKRILVYPDQKSGEFFVDLPPVKYKVTKLYAQGYSTLFNNGEAAQIVDLSVDSLTKSNVYTHEKNNHTLYTTYNASYCRTFHAPIRLSYQQIKNGTTSDVLGEEELCYTNVYGENVKYTLAKYDEVHKKASYTFKHPVFDEGRVYLLKISANEEYIYNGNDSSRIKKVSVPNLTLNISNGLTTEKKIVEGKMDENGTFTLRFKANNPTFNLTNEDALRYLELSASKDGYGFKATPLAAFVTGTRYKGSDVYTAKDADVTLLDVLRDPPGAGSSAYIESGAKYAYTRDWSLSGSLGLNVSIKSGTNYTAVVGSWAGEGAGSFYATVSNGSTTYDNSAKIPVFEIPTIKGSSTYSFTVNDRIETSSGKYDVGAMFDVYIGTTTDMIAQKMDVLSVIDHKTYKSVAHAINQGSVKVVAKSSNEENDTTASYLVVAEKIRYNIENPVMFVYTQEHIIKHIIPNLLAERDGRLITADEKTAQKIADATGEVQYFTSLTQADVDFGVKNYGIAEPSDYGYTVVDEIAGYNERIQKWINLISMNELEKIHAIKSGELFASYDLSSSTKIVHTESDEAYDYDDSKIPFSTRLGYKMESVGAKVGNAAVNAGLKFFLKGNPSSKGSTDMDMVNKIEGLINNSRQNDENPVVAYETPLSKISFSIYPFFDVNFSNAETQKMIHQRKAGFTLSTNLNGYMDIDVYRTPLKEFTHDSIVRAIAQTTAGANPLVNGYLDNYVYYVRGGATRSPYEKVDYTIFAPYGEEVGGFPLGTKTLKIDNPKIVIENPIRTNVPQDEKTTFKVTLSNETELNAVMGTTISTLFVLKQNTKSNADNVKVSCDGEPLPNGVKIKLAPGEKVVKTIEVERGNSFDIENLAILLTSDEDVFTEDKAFISISYVNSASPIKLDAPINNWVMNTYSAKDSIGYFIPISVSGFNVNHEGFDHIEIQYKEKTRGDDAWVTLCSYYNDSTLFDEASGVKEMIVNGVIRNARFYGAKDPMEMEYDIRAVSFSRFGNSFVTRSSEVASGVKDTRCPKVFGIPEPSDGTLAYGDVIKLPFTEPIAYNILDETSNFSILGYKASSSLKESTALKFTGKSSQMAKSEVSRNLVEKDFTIDMMVKTSKDRTDMTFFSHGDSETGGLSFGIDSEQRLTATINGETFKSEVLKDGLSGALTRVGMIYYDDSRTVDFFVGNKSLERDSTFSLNSNYRGNGPIYLGSDFSQPGQNLFSGSMLEVRVWAKALDEEELSAYNGKLLNGYEYMLVAHYPLTETQGNSAIDAAHGANLKLNNTAWASKTGHSLRTNAKPVRLDGLYVSKAKTSDYTLSFWYKSEKSLAGNADTLALFSAGSEVLPDSGANKFFIGYIGENLMLRSNGVSYKLSDAYADGDWHQFTLAVNRSKNISRCYIDGNYVSQLQSSVLGGIASDYVTLGNSKSNFYFDEFALWNLALPNEYVERYYNAVQNAFDTDLSVYLPFDADVESNQGQVENSFSIYNEKRQYDTNVELHAKKTPILLDATNLNDESSIWAPVAEKASLSKLDFTWSYSDNALLIKLLEKEADINDQIIYLTVRNVEDKNGNVMQNPAMWSVHTDLNLLSFDEREIRIRSVYGEEGDFTLEMSNYSGSYRNYKISNSSDWLVPYVSKGTALPEISEKLNFHFNGTNDPGTYVDVVYLEDENGLVSTCIVNLEVSGTKPEYKIKNDAFDYTMVYKGLVKIKTVAGAEVIDNNKDDVVYAFIDGQCVGESNIQVNEDGSSFVYMNIYGTQSNHKKHSEITFKVWNNRNGKLLDMVSTSAPVTFTKDGVVGAKATDTLIVSNKVVRNLYLKKGWNWISINIKPTRSANPVADIFANNVKPFSPSDMIKSPTGYDQFGQKTNSWAGTITKLGNDTVYQIKVAEAGTYCYSGEDLKEEELKVKLRGGRWEHLPYLLDESQPINTALKDLQIGVDANVGDVIKGLTQFAILSENLVWEGTLTHLRAGEGYYIKLQNVGKRTFYYHKEEETSQALRSATLQTETYADEVTAEHANNMPVIAQFGDDVDFEEGDKLLALSNGKKIGESDLRTVAGKKLFLLSVNAEQGDRITFAQERNGRIIANTNDPVKYDADNILGSTTAPHIISFASDFVEVTPTLFSTEVAFRFHAKEFESVMIDVYNSDGVSVWNSSTNVTGDATVDMNGSNLAAGVYYATIKMGEAIKTVKLIKK